MKKLLPTLLFICIAYISLGQQHSLTLQNCLAPFYHGVASGDPTESAIILWTRITPDSSEIGQSINVNWQIATDTGMVNVVQSGALTTDSTKDFTVKVDVTNLNPNTFYYYEFRKGNFYSPRGRTKTNPTGASVDSLRFAIVSCANFEAGYFNVYASLLQRADFDAVICLGDYIYEYNTGGYSPNANVNRQWSPANEIITLGDYRMRYSTYHLDEDLQRLHQQFPFITIYDDHEFANDAWMNGAENHTPSSEGLFSARKAMAQKAYFEWLPIRQTSVSNPYQIYRTIKYGDLVEFMMLDTRIEGRDEQDGTSGTTVNSTSRQLLGTTQYNWLTTKLSASTSRWKVLGQQVMMAPLKVFGAAVNGDQWDGYPAERQRVYNYILNNNISNMVVITGDIHSSWANDLPTSNYNSSTGAGSAGVEFVAPSVTSPGISLLLGATALQLANSHIKYCDLSSHGYVIMDVNKNRTQADWYNINTIDNQSTAFTFARSHYVNNSQRFLSQSNFSAAPRNSIYAIKSPLCPRTFSPVGLTTNYEAPVLLSAYPNPAHDFMSVQLYQAVKGELTFEIYDMSGKLLNKIAQGNTEQGVAKYYIATNELADGIYFLKINTAGNSKTIKFVKN